MNAQNPGDTISVQALSFNSTTRDTVVSFPTDPNITFEKVILKYTMRCKDGLVSNGTNTNLGCGEWDYSCNTYLVDSSKIETLPNSVPSHFITNYSDPTFLYKETPVYNYLRGTQSDVQIVTTNSETSTAIGTGVDNLNRTLSTNNLAGKSHYLYTAAELAAGGLTAGNIEALSLNVLANSGEANFLKIKLKNSTKTELNGLIDFDDFTEVYYKNTTLAPNQINRFNFYTPFVWDGSSNVLVEFNFTNVDATSLTETLVEGETTTQNMGLSSTNEQEILLTNNAYVQCNDYKGIGGEQNRTIEAWIKTTDGTNGEICSWGTNITGRKWVYRLTNGRLRLEVHGGGTESTTTVDDGQWHHVVCVLNGNNLGDISFYIDGVLDPNSVVGTTNINTAETPDVRISRGVNNRYLDGVVDEVRIWNTNLSEATINEWKNLKVDDTHPNYSNLQLYYQFNGSGNQILDSSIHSRDAVLVGTEYKVSELDGSSLFKDFILTEQRPNLTFFQGDYVTQVTTTEVDKPIIKEPRHFVTTRTIVPGDPTVAKHDEIVDSAPQEYWTLDEKIFDEVTGNLITENILPADGEIIITDLAYFNRFPFYNELVSFVTPYGIGLDLGMEGKSWYMDMSDYVSILKGNKRMLMTLGGQWQEDMDLEFLFIVGTPPRDVVQYEQIWQGTNRIGIARIDQILDDSKLPPVTMPLDANASSFVLKSSITGHGAEGEFQQNGGAINHRIFINQAETFTWDINQECSENPIFPQGGTWVYDRQGWCPGEETFKNENDLTSFVTAGSSFEIDYSTSVPSNSAGDYRYHIAHQLIGYSDANFQLDAAVVGIIAPNNSAEFTRIGTICANPQIIIKNTGATELNQLTITYWLNDSQSPQTFEWSGFLDFMEEEIVTIPSPKELWFDILDENNKFHVEISKANQSTDEYSFNNKMSSNINIPEILPHNITVEFRTNSIPGQNSYQLVDGSGNNIGLNNLQFANTTFTDEYNLEDECYKLIVNDTGGDGVQWWANPGQGTGFIRLKDENGMTLKTFEPDFGGGFEYSFTTDFTISIEELEFLTSIKLFPNPTQDYCTIEANDLSDANVYLTDILGQSIAASIISKSDDSISLNVEHLNDGVYFVVIKKGDVLTTRKLIVE